MAAKSTLKFHEYLEDLEVSWSDESDFEVEFVSEGWLVIYHLLVSKDVKLTKILEKNLYTCCHQTHFGNENIQHNFQF